MTTSYIKEELTNMHSNKKILSFKALKTIIILMPLKETIIVTSTYLKSQLLKVMKMVSKLIFTKEEMML